MSPNISSREPGMALAVAMPPLGLTSGSLETVDDEGRGLHPAQTGGAVGAAADRGGLTGDAGRREAPGDALGRELAVFLFVEVIAGDRGERLD